MNEVSISARPQFRVRRRHLRADSRSGRLGRHALIGSSLAGLLCANEEEVNLAGQSAIVMRSPRIWKHSSFHGNLQVPNHGSRTLFQHGSERQSKEVRPRKVLAIFGAGRARSRSS